MICIGKRRRLAAYFAACPSVRVCEQTADLYWIAAEREAITLPSFAQMAAALTTVRRAYMAIPHHR